MAGQEFFLQVSAALPDKLRRLTDLAGNLWFSWHRPTRQLFALLDRELWWRVGRNPKVFLRCVDQAVLNMAAGNETFLGAYRRVLAEFDSYLDQTLTGYMPAGLAKDDLVAYFCAEYGFHDSVPLYSGGLGILAGDHCKTASDMRLPFVAVGLLYRQGYFTQRIDEHGHQIAEYRYTPADDIPVTPLRNDAGQDVLVQVRFPGRSVSVRIWRAAVGRVTVLLLDTDVCQNEDADRTITQVLYGGDQAMRIQQEIVLGIGGVRALRAAGFKPTVWHINEGHPAFQVIERARELMAQDLPFAAALEEVAASTVFTTHTPVVAGHDVFPRELVLRYFQDKIKDLGISDEAFLRLGQHDDQQHQFNMTRLAVSGSRSVNGVSAIHGSVSSEILSSAWPNVRPQENPVGYVTNGVHVPTFMREEWTELLGQHLGASWHYELMDRQLMQNIMDIPDGRFWYVNQRVKSEMLNALRNRIERQHVRNRVSSAHIHRLMKNIDPENPNVLTIGFARRFATYKRHTLLLTDLGWLKEIVDKEERPVVFIFAGKAHPADEPGQRLMHEVHQIANQPEFFGKILLVEGYDIDLGSLLTSGVDVWLNNPIYPMEASGTSGMKAAINGTVNLSVLDGWWAEGYDGSNGWAIPPASNHRDDGDRNRQDARTLYEILQDDVIPLYYRRDEKLGYSPGWVQICKRSMASVLPHFNSNRLLHDYACCFYGPAAAHGRKIAAQAHVPARELADWKARVREAWPGISLRIIQPVTARVEFDQAVQFDVVVQLNGLSPQDVRVECVLHRETCSHLAVPVKQYSQHGRVRDGVRYVGDEAVFVAPFAPSGEASASGECGYRLELVPPWCGALRYEIRAMPQHACLSTPYETGLMRWL
ncbi:MAG: alpha-glucan family phosphorylase [Gammaproteobacteria bacterium]|nr:MAG: alpha-glucan family phosphorylase [Gammaproteobacteria bacterium]